jgi:hypothetical protein
VRPQRRPSATVNLVQVADTIDHLGDLAGDSPRTKVAGAIFNPQAITERSGEGSAPIVRAAFFNVPGTYVLDADDLVEVLDRDGQVVETWQVVGGSAVWLNRTKIPVQLASRASTIGG